MSFVNVGNEWSDEGLVVSNRNVFLLVSYCRKRGISQRTLLAHLGYPEAYLINPDHWISLPVFLEICERVMRAFGNDPTVLYEVGLTATEEGGLGMLEVLKRAIGAIFVDPSFLIKKIPAYNHYFNRTKNIELIRADGDSAVLKIKFLPSVEVVADFESGPLTKGVLASIPCIWNLPPADVDEILLEYDVVRLLKERFSIFAEMKDQVLYVESEPHGRIVELVGERVGASTHYLGKYQELGGIGDGLTGILITRALRYKNYPLLIPGQIYNAPYFILNLHWEKVPFVARLRKLFPFRFLRPGDYLKDLEEKTTHFQHYARELEETIKERNHFLISEKKKTTRLTGELNAILSSHLPPELVAKMTMRKIAPKRNRGIVLFADLVGFSRKVHENENFAPMLQDLNRFFDFSSGAIRTRGGWVYKYLGDGIMAIFGGLNDNEPYLDLAKEALLSAEKIVKQVREMGWEVRVGIEYGDFIAGEIGPSGTRIWDFLGETVNLACRLSQSAQPNEIIIGPAFMRLMYSLISVEERDLVLKGIGEQKAYVYKSFLAGAKNTPLTEGPAL